MKKTIKIGEREVDMVSNALTPILYKKIFHRDLFLETKKKDEDLSFVPGLAFVQTMQAEDRTPRELTELTMDDYYDWLSSLEAMDIMLSSSDILTLFFGQSTPTSKAKKKRRRRTGSTTRPFSS